MGQGWIDGVFRVCGGTRSASAPFRPSSGSSQGDGRWPGWRAVPFRGGGGFQPTDRPSFVGPPRRRTGLEPGQDQAAEDVAEGAWFRRASGSTNRGKREHLVERTAVSDEVAAGQLVACPVNGGSGHPELRA